jgi:Ca2+/Na+ antiporter
MFSFSFHGFARISHNFITDYLMAPSKEIFHAVVCEMKHMITSPSNFELNDEDLNTLPSNTCDTGSIYSHGSLLEVPSRQSNREMASYILVYPILFLIQYSVPDIRVVNHKGMPISIISKAAITVLSSIIWSVVSNYILIYSLESLAGKFYMISGNDAKKLIEFYSCFLGMMKFPAVIIGCTFISGVSLWPTYVATAMCAEKGFGSSAVLDAMSSNIFNILVGLGIPWGLYTSMGTGFLPYDELRNEGILQLVIFLCLSQVIFILSILINGFQLINIHGIIFILIYATFLVYAFGRVYW